jgi:methyl-accepting chemotaxis protein
MNSISLKAKIALLALILIGSMLIVAIVGIYQLFGLNRQLNILVNQNSKAVQLVGQARADIAAVVREERQTLLAQTVDGATKQRVIAVEAQSKAESTVKALADSIATLENEGAASDIRQIVDDLGRLEENSNNVLNFAVQKTNTQGAKILYGDYYVIASGLADPLRELGEQVPAALDARAKMFRVGLMVANHLGASSDQEMTDLERVITQEKLKLIGYTQTIATTMSVQDKQKFPNVVSELERLPVLADQILKLSTANTDIRAAQLSGTTTASLILNINKHFATLDDRLQKLLRDQQEDADRKFGQGVIGILLMGAIGTVIAAVFTYLLAKSMNQAVGAGLTTLKQLSQGDLTARMGLDRKDEMGQLSKATDEMTTSVSKTVQQIRELAQVLGGSSGDLTAVSHDLLSQSHQMSTQAQAVASSTEELSTNINTMAAAAEEMSANVAGISSASEEVSVNVGTISASAEQMSRSVGAVADSVRAISQSLTAVAQDAKEESRMTDRATKMATEATQTIQQLEHAAREINKVSEVIKTIALQTNLLALNATIEATSAGEAGKGFAVVAGEIKELALQSGQSAEDIARRIEGVQASTQQAVKAIEGIARLVGEINTAAGRISSAVEVQTQGAHQIESAVAQTRGGIDNVARSIAEVAKGTTDMSSNTAEVSRAATDVSRNAAEAAKASHHIASNIHGVSDATKQNTLSSTKVNEASRKLAEIAKSLEASVSRFKTT